MSLAPGDPPRSMLFVSGENPARFSKAMQSVADLVCIDLEDAVEPGRKSEARHDVLSWLQSPDLPVADIAAIANPTMSSFPGRTALRVNGLHTEEGFRDLHALLDSGIYLDWLLMPKVEDPTELRCVSSWLGGRVGRIAALIETPRGISRMEAIAQAGGALGALMLGGADLATELGAQFAWEPLLHARACLVNAARQNGLQAWDVPHVNLDDLADLGNETRRALALGFDCKSAIHPKQLEAIHAAHQPSASDLEWARLVNEAVPSGQMSGAFLFRGKLVDAPLLRKARHILSRAARQSLPSPAVVKA
jgi:citrate lyase beta subunit